MMLTAEQYAQLKKQQYKNKKIQQQVRNNQKSAQGFGYTYKPVVFETEND